MGNNYVLFSMLWIDEEIAEMFKTYDKPSKISNQSTLALLLERVGDVDNPFKEYCKFDGEVVQINGLK